MPRSRARHSETRMAEFFDALTDSHHRDDRRAAGVLRRHRRAEARGSTSAPRAYDAFRVLGAAAASPISTSAARATRPTPICCADGRASR